MLLAASPPPEPPVHLLLPLASSVLYVFAAVFLKKAGERGAGVWRTTFVSNCVTASVFALLPLFIPGRGGPTYFWQPLCIGALFILGQAATMYALNRGDVSVATPVVGTKVIFVAFFAVITGKVLTGDLWLSAAMSACGIALLNRGGGGASRHHVGRTIVASLVAAASYGLFDILVVSWAGNWGTGPLLAWSMAASAAGSLIFWPAFEGPILTLPKPSLLPLLGGSAFLATQSTLLVATVGLFEDTTRINVVYNGRGLWSVVLLAMIGHWIGNRELRGGGAVVLWRFAGAALMLGAILVAVVRPLEG